MRGRSSRMPRQPTLTLCLAASLGLSVLGGASCTLDPVAAAQEAAFEQEEDFGPLPGSNSEYHRPGQDCMACHGPRGSADSKFEVAGTVFWSTCIDPEAGPDECVRTTVDHAEVRLVDGAGTEKCIYTNCAGNFFVRVGKWQPTSPSATPVFPMLSSVRKKTDEGAAREKIMQGHINRWGSCNDCHRTSPYWNSAGQIFLYDEPEQVPASAGVDFEKCKTVQVSVDDVEQCPRVPQ